MFAVLLSFLASVFWGSSDFVAGFGSRRFGALRVTLIAYVGATIFTCVAFLLDTKANATGVFTHAEAGTSAAMVGAVQVGAVAALATTIGLITFYAALTLAPMGVVTAIVAAAEVVLPVLIGVFLQGERLTFMGWAGVIIAALGAVWVGGVESGRTRTGFTGVLLAVVAGVGFGLGVIALDYAPAGSGLTTPFVQMAGGLTLTFMLVAATWVSTGLRRFTVSMGVIVDVALNVRAWMIGLTCGVLQGGANLLLLAALREGRLAVVGVIVCLYPVTTALLARFIVKEVLTGKHWFGIGVALAGCVLLAFA